MKCVYLCSDTTMITRVSFVRVNKMKDFIETITKNWKRILTLEDKIIVSQTVPITEVVSC